MASPWSGEEAGPVGEVEGEGSPPGCFLFMAITRVSCRGAVGTTGLGRSQGRRRAGARSTGTRQNGRQREQRTAPGACRAGRVSLTPELSPVVKRRVPDHGTGKGRARRRARAPHLRGNEVRRSGRLSTRHLSRMRRTRNERGRSYRVPQGWEDTRPEATMAATQSARSMSLASFRAGHAVRVDAERAERGGRATAARNPRQRIPPATSRGRIFPRRRRPPGRHSGAGPSSLLRAEDPGRTGPRAPQAGRKGAK